MAVSEQQRPLARSEFADLLVSCCPGFDGLEQVAVAVSGGPDSLALAAWLHDRAQACDKRPELHVITVDHGLRPESAREAQQVARIVGNWPAARHVTLEWTGDKPATGLQEAARNARYELIADYCHDHGIGYVFTAHHADDQAETVLFRLARGTGLDGLAGMPLQQPLQSGVVVLRPLLGVEKSRLLATCQAFGLDYSNDPSNTDTAFTRPRLRRAYDVLADEGLTGRRLQRTAGRLARARAALARYTQDAIAAHVTQEENGWVIARDTFTDLPEEIGLRIMQAAFVALGHSGGAYPPRMEKQETLLQRLREERDFKGATLGGCRFALDGQDRIHIRPEAEI